MKMRILNKNCMFTCPALQGAISKTQTSPHHCKNGAGNFLTTKTALSGNGICSILTTAAQGAPTPCSLKMATTWTDGIEMKKKINGVSMLNENAKMICPVGSVISVQKPLLPTAVMPVSSAMMMPMANAMVSDSAVSAESISSEASSPPEKTELKQQEQAKPTEKETAEKEMTAEPTQKQSVETLENVKACLCSYDSCENAGNCPYANAPSTIDTNGAAAKLRKNSSRKETDYDERAERNMEKGKISWNNQAHHMISINAAYCQYPELVKLGNYFGYDINCEENCYFLPCWESGDGYGKKTSHYKKAQAYDVMHVSGLQWHVGQHSYRIDIPDSTKEKFPELRTMECYNDRINKDVKGILNACNQRFNGVCLAENYEIHKNWFIEKMHALSEQIEECLDLFDGSAKDSFPYFVSLEALRYAYEIPRNGKVIFIYPTAAKWNLKKFQYTNYLKNDGIQLNLLHAHEVPIAKNHRDETIKQIILFCENVTCFLIVDDTKSFQLPFQHRVHSQYIHSNESEKIESHFSALLAELADTGEEEYIAPKAMVAKRLKECGLL